MAVVSSVIVPYASYLRVYEPLAAFPEPERGHWARYAERGRTPGAQDELRRALADLVPTPPVAVPVHESADAFVAEVDGVVCVCPWRTRLRGWQALEELAGQFPEPVLDALLPPVVRRRGRGGLRAVAGAEPGRPAVDPDGGLARPCELVHSLFGRRAGVCPGGERRGPRAALPHPDGPGPAPPRAGAADAARPHRRGPLIEGLVEVGRWLEEFHPRSLVELDYGGLVHALPQARLEEDRSAADVAEGIAALRAGDGAGAARAYERFTERWRAVREQPARELRDRRTEGASADAVR